MMKEVTPFPVDVRPGAYGVEYREDLVEYPGCAGCDPSHDDYGNDFCRCRNMSNTTVDDSTIDLCYILSMTLGISVQDLSEELIRLATDELHLDDPNTYEVVFTNDYYGDIGQVSLRDEMLVEERLRTYFRDERDDMVDFDFILPYVRAKGISTQGLEPIEALYAQLLDEHGNDLPEAVHQCKGFTIQSLNVNSIDIDPDRASNAIPASPMPPDAGITPFWGVVMRNPGTGRYDLVDGARRLAFLESAGQQMNFTDQSDGTARFIILE